ncbi:MAG: iron-containing alcohol dehydrogenase [Veillonellales bacterium]
MISYNFFNPTRLVFGEHTLGQVGKWIADSGYTRVLLLAGAGSIQKNGVYDAVTASLNAEKIQWAECFGVQPNPSLSKVREAINLALEHQVEAVLAVGGGSVIDTAKAVAAGVFLDDIWQAFEGEIRISKALPVFTVLTLSATASEMNGNAVITNERDKKKWGIGSSFLYPKVSIIDPSVQTSLPWEQTVNGALDALAHIMEFYFVGKEEETSISIHEALMKTIIAMVDKLQENPKDVDSRANLAWAATLALNGISGAGMRGGDWACHGMEHSISCLNSSIAHGAGLGILFPAWMQYVYDENPKQFNRFAQNIWQSASLSAAIRKMRARIKKWQGHTRLHELGIREEQLNGLAENAVAQGSLGRLKKLHKSDVEQILRLAY